MDDPDRNSARRTAILDAAGETLLHYGFRKSSVDDVARLAGISRQGLYLYFGNKDALFAAAVDHLLERSIATARAALRAPESPLDERLLGAFAALAGSTLVSRLDEVLDTAERLTGRSSEELEGEVVAEFATVLEEEPASSPWRRNGDGAESVATLLYGASAGLKRLVPSSSEYLDGMRRAVQFVCNP